MELGSRPSEAIEELQMCGGSQDGVRYFWLPHPHQLYDRQWPVWGEENLRDLRWQLVLVHVLLDRGCMDQTFQALGPDFAPKCQVISTAAARRTGCELLRGCGLCPNRRSQALIFFYCSEHPSIPYPTIFVETGGVMNHWYLHVPHYEPFGQFIQIFLSLERPICKLSLAVSCFQGCRGCGCQALLRPNREETSTTSASSLVLDDFFQLGGLQNLLKTSPNQSQTFYFGHDFYPWWLSIEMIPRIRCFGSSRAETCHLEQIRRRGRQVAMVQKNPTSPKWEFKIIQHP